MFDSESFISKHTTMLMQTTQLVMGLAGMLTAMWDMVQ